MTAEDSDTVLVMCSAALPARAPIELCSALFLPLSLQRDQFANSSWAASSPRTAPEESRGPDEPDRGASRYKTVHSAAKKPWTAGTRLWAIRRLIGTHVSVTQIHQGVQCTVSLGPSLIINASSRCGTRHCTKSFNASRPRP